MIEGFGAFKKHFEGFEDCYTIIGGTACDILMSEVSLDFRATKDVDMILLMENRFAEFAKVFWEFVRDGGYKCGWKSADEPHFYRFTGPQKGYPIMLELFSRRPDFQPEDAAFHLTPLPVSDEVSSLSAIMLDDDYYRLMLSGRKTVAGVSVLGAEHLIVFKAKAYLDLRQKKADGMHVNERDLKKHKNDVFRLFAIADPTMHIALSDKVAAEMRVFLDVVTQEPVNLRDLKLNEFLLDDILKTMREMYQLDK